MKEFLLLFTLSLFAAGCGNINSAPAHSTPVAYSSNSNTNIAPENFKEEWKKAFPDALAKLKTNFELWQGKKIINYDFMAWKTAPGVSSDWAEGPPVFINVRKNIATSIKYEHQPPDLERSTGYDEFDTIDKLFAYLKTELESGKMLQVTYDKEFGYPKKSSIIHAYISHGARTLDVEQFEVTDAIKERV